MIEEKRILAVDDESKNLSAIKRIFWEDEDITLAFAENGNDALEKVRSFAPDIVLLDILMPGMDGYEVCKKIKNNPETSHIMVLLLSGKSALEDRIKGYDAQADDYITKPYDPDELKAKISILLRLKGAQDSLREINLNLENMVQLRTRELIQSEQQAMIGRMAHGIVHNLKGPFSGVKGFAELIKITLKDSIDPVQQGPEEIGETLKTVATYIDQCLFSCTKLEEMINDLLTKGRQDASVKKTSLDLNEILRTDLEFLQGNLEFKHKITKRLKLADNVPTIQGVPSDFSQIFCNLIQNAIDAMHDSAPKTLTIQSEVKGGTISFHFTDSGPGVPQELQKQIFEPFFSTKKMRNEVEKGESFGTGLGLYTCAEILKPYGGSISVANKGGARFTIDLPFPSSQV